MGYYSLKNTFLMSNFNPPSKVPESLPSAGLHYVTSRHKRISKITDLEFWSSEMLFYIVIVDNDDGYRVGKTYK